jgi:hypothetical protein
MSEAMSHKTVYWFKAKRYGYGWGLPCSWQGWAFFLPWLALVSCTVWELAVPRHGLFTLALALEAAVLILVCYWKGEPLPPR